VVASLALHAGVVLDVVAVGQSASLVAAEDEWCLALHAAGLLGLETIFDDTGIGASI